MPGLLITGTRPKCGKTVASTGLAGVLAQLGFPIRPIKPFNFQPLISIRQGYEQAYFDRVIPPLQPLTPFFTESPEQMTQDHWQRLIEICRKRHYPYFLESPGSVASPMRYSQEGVMDVIDLARVLELSIVLVTKRQTDIAGILTPLFSYLNSRSASLVGWLSVETSPVDITDWDVEVMHLRSQFQIPYLGDIAYSPSISVEAMQQGNLLRNTESGIDLLPIQQALHLSLPC